MTAPVPEPVAPVVVPGRVFPPGWCPAGPGSGPPAWETAAVGMPVVAVVGPTAVGKSDLGVALALELGGEVVNADSMQLYRGMDI